MGFPYFFFARVQIFFSCPLRVSRRSIIDDCHLFVLRFSECLLVHLTLPHELFPMFWVMSLLVHCLRGFFLLLLPCADLSGIWEEAPCFGQLYVYI